MALKSETPGMLAELQHMVRLLNGGQPIIAKNMQQAEALRRRGYVKHKSGREFELTKTGLRKVELIRIARVNKLTDDFMSMLTGGK